MRQFLRLLPLPGILIALYLVVAYIDEGAFARTLASLTLPSGHVWALDLRDLFVAGALLMLFLEVFKSARATHAVIFEHSLAFVALVVALLLFLLVPRAGTSLFAILTLACGIDVIAGFTVTLAAARRSIEIERS